jgi:anthranilate synthase component 1
LRDALSKLDPAPVSTASGFAGGLVGYVGYDMVRFFENLQDEKAPDIDIPDMYFLFPEKLVIMDSFTGNRTLVHFVHTGPQENPVSAYRRGTGLIDGLARAVEAPVPRVTTHPLAVSPPQSLVSREEFEDAVRKVKEYIVAGDVIQVVLSRRFSCAAEGDSLSLYRALRRINPSPYMFLLDLVDHSLIGSSPETLVKVEAGRIELKPIAGTRRRGRDVKEDRELERELLADEKERAEHVMLVDLARNDAGRAARAGTVEVRDLMSVDRFSHVMHIVSCVQAEMAEGLDAFDVFRAAFPAGTVTGAPKVRAMEIIDELERHRRGFYAGAVGYFAVNGDMDFCITIRTMLKKDGFIYFQAGAGIVADSVPEREYEETFFKSQALVNAITGENEGGTR